MASGFDMTIESLKEELLEIKQRLSQYRKKGIETKIVELRIANIPSKIKMIEVTRDLKDVQKADAQLKLAKIDADELELLYQEKINQKPEVHKDEEVSAIESLLDDAERLAAGKKMQEGKIQFMKCYKAYNELKPENKGKVFERLNKLRALLQNVV